MLAARQAHIGFEPGGPDGCDGERLPGERADGTVGFQDGAGQAGVSAGLCGFAEYSVGEGSLGATPSADPSGAIAVGNRAQSYANSHGC